MIIKRDRHIDIMADALISIIVPVHNSERYLRQALDSIVYQTMIDWQCLIVDDCSIDNSATIIQEYINEDKRFISLKTARNSGPAVARNLALKKIRGRYICFLDSDDFWYPEKLEEQLTTTHKHNCAICYSAFDRINSEGIWIRYQPTKPTTDYKRTLYNNLLNLCSVMLDRQHLDNIEFPENMGHEDLGLWLRLLKQVPHAVGIEKALLAYRVHDDSRNINITTRFRHQWQIYLKQEKMPFLYALWFFCLHTWSGFSKRRLEGLLPQQR